MCGVLGGGPFANHVRKWWIKDCGVANLVSITVHVLLGSYACFRDRRSLHSIQSVLPQDLMIACKLLWMK